MVFVFYSRSANGWSEDGRRRKNISLDRGLGHWENRIGRWRGVTISVVRAPLRRQSRGNGTGSRRDVLLMTWCRGERPSSDVAAVTWTPGRTGTLLPCGPHRSHPGLALVFFRPEAVRAKSDDGDDIRTLSTAVSTATENHSAAVSVDLERGTRRSQGNPVGISVESEQKWTTAHDDRHHLQAIAFGKP